MVTLAATLIFVTTVALAGATEACIEGVDAAVKAGAKKVWAIIHKPKAAAKKVVKSVVDLAD